MVAQGNSFQELELESGFDWQSFLFRCWSKWYWFVLSLLLCLGWGVFEILRTPPLYQRQAMVLIKDDQSSRNTNIEQQFSQLGLRSSSMVSNEMLAFQSPSLAQDVVKRLHLDVSYHTKGRFHDHTLYGSTLPLQVTFLTLGPEDAASLRIQYTQQGSVELSDFQSTRAGTQYQDQVVQGRLHQTISTPIGRVIVTPTSHFSSIIPQTIQVTRLPLEQATAMYNTVNVELAQKDAEMITLSCSDVSAERATDIINAHIEAYNEAWLSDKKQVALTTSKFINERLRIIEEELGSVDRRISNYKSANLMPNADAASDLYMRKTQDNSDKLTSLESQLYMAQFVQTAVGSENKDYEILPANSGLNAPAIETMIAEHNRDVLERNRIVLNSSAANSRVQELDDRIHKERQAIIASVNNLIVTLQAQIGSLKTQAGSLTSKIAQAPKQSSFLTSIGREQEVKSTLYIFLLQKREENELSIAFTALNTRVVTPPMGSTLPIAPVKNRIMLIAFAVGLFLPFVLLYLKEILNTRIRNRKDIEHLSLPYIGEIPQMEGTQANTREKLLGFLGWKVSRPRTDNAEIVVKAQQSDLMNDAFRVVRTNFEFVVERQEQGIVTMIVSANPGSGKTFVTMNLAMSMVLKGKRAVVVDLDLRKANASLFVNRPKIGISNILNDQCELRDVVCHYSDTDLAVIPVGTIPPNPTELLYSERLSEVIEQLRQEYDYVFLDCPPVEIVADSAIVAHHVDRTIFVARAGLLERSLLPDIEKNYQTERYPKMMLLLNGTSDEYKPYGYRRYGYKYGYYGHSS